jgi:hypothetical protein
VAAPCRAQGIDPLPCCAHQAYVVAAGYGLLGTPASLPAAGHGGSDLGCFVLPHNRDLPCAMWLLCRSLRCTHTMRRQHCSSSLVLRPSTMCFSGTVRYAASALLLHAWACLGGEQNVNIRCRGCTAPRHAQDSLQGSWEQRKGSAEEGRATSRVLRHSWLDTVLTARPSALLIKRPALQPCGLCRAGRGV